MQFDHLRWHLYGILFAFITLDNNQLELNLLQAIIILTKSILYIQTLNVEKKQDKVLTYNLII